MQTQPSGQSNGLVHSPIDSNPWSNRPQEAVIDDDGWGDFEVAEPELVEPVVQQPDPWPVTAPLPQGPPPAYEQEPPRTRLVRASTMDIINNSLVDYNNNSLVDTDRPLEPAHVASRQSPRAERWKQKPSMKSTTADADVLFDVNDFELQEGDEDEDEEEDEFGDFETVASTVPKPKESPNPWSTPETTPSMDLLSLDEPPQPVPKHPVESKPPSKLSAPMGFGATATKQRPTPKSSSSLHSSMRAKPSTTQSSAAVKATIDEGDEWAAWDNYVPDVKVKEDKGSSKIASESDNWDWDAAESATPVQTKTSDDEPPPTNVPPPSVLLSVFPSLLATGDSLFKPITGQNASIKQRILSDPKAVDFLRGYILLATTAARVIAGRKHRWHRDKILAKSMSFSAAGSKGMKLAGVDKSQSIREDREAADVADVWREYVGRLRSAVAAANSADNVALKVPEISENLSAHTAKNVPTAPKPCVICGLKRDERVTKVDYEVEDSFGEWWVDYWGHRACKNFWIEHEQMLRQR